jgi:hypothetical protein
MTSESAADLVGSLPTGPNRDKRVDASEAIRLIRDRDAVVVGGFIGVAPHIYETFQEATSSLR